MAQLIALDLQSNLICNAGARIARLIAGDRKLTQNVNTSDRLEFSVKPGTDGAALLIHGGFVRTVFSDGVADEEYIITDVTPSYGERAGPVRVTAAPAIPIILNRAGTLVTFSSGGIPSYDDGRTQLTLEEYIDDILIPYLALRGITYIDVGTISALVSSILVDYDWFNVGAMQWFKDLLNKPTISSEWRWRRNGSTNYLLDIAPQINIGAAVPQFRNRKNLRSHTPRSDGAKMANAILVRGAELNGIPQGIEESTFTITDITGTTITFAGTPVEANGAWDNKYLMKDASTPSSTQIATSTYPNQVTLGSVSGFAEGDVVMLRETSGGNGKEVSLLTHPASIAAHGYAEFPHSIPDIHGYRNWLKNAGFALWSSGDTSNPDFWTVLGGSGTGTLAISKNTDPEFILNGTYSLKVGLTNAGHFLDNVRVHSSSMYVHQRTGKSRITVIANVYMGGAGLSTGNFLKMTLLGSDTLDGQVSSVITATPVGVGWWTLAIVGFDCSVGPRNIFDVRISVAAEGSLGVIGGNAWFYVDSVMVAFSETGDIPFTPDSFANALRQGGISRLLQYNAGFVEHALTLYDIGAENDEDKITIGGNVYLFNDDPATATDTTLRCEIYERDFERIKNSRVTLGSQAIPLTRTLVAA